MSRPKRYTEAFWGPNFCSSAGFEALKKRTKDGRATCKTYTEYLRSRAKAEDEYSKSLYRSCKLLSDTADTGSTMSQALDCMKHETEKTADVHADLSSQLASAAHRMTEFINRQKAEIKLHEDAVDRCIRNKLSLFRQVTDTKRQYEQRSLEAHNGDAAYNRVRQDQQSTATKEYDKVIATARKTKQDAEKAKQTYRDAVSRLDIARIEWESRMQEFCKVCEAQDESRIKMLQNEMWICCNLLSQLAVDVDEHAEMVRQKLEKVDVVGDLQAFIATSGTGAEKPAQVIFEAYQLQHSDVSSHQVAPPSASVCRPETSASSNPPPMSVRATKPMPKAAVLNGRVQAYQSRSGGEPPLQIVNKNFRRH